MQQTCIFINLNVNEETLYFNFYVNIGIIPHSKIQVCLIILLKCLAPKRNQRMNFLVANFNCFNILFFSYFMKSIAKVFSRYMFIQFKISSLHELLFDHFYESFTFSLVMHNVLSGYSRMTNILFCWFSLSFFIIRYLKPLKV